MTIGARQLDTADLEERVKSMYEQVALDPHQDFHFETGRPLAERLGYPTTDLDRIPGESIDSFAGVGYFSTSLRLPLAKRFSTWAVDPEWTASWPRRPSDRRGR